MAKKESAVKQAAPDVRYLVFVSSTFEDLKPQRKKVQEEIIKMNHMPSGMELWPASGKSVEKVVKRAIDYSDFYLLLLGCRYGSKPDGEQHSFTELEYDYALKNGKPMRVLRCSYGQGYTRDDNWSSGLDAEQFEVFCKKVSSVQEIKPFHTEADLVSEVRGAIDSMVRTDATPEMGWIRACHTIGKRQLDSTRESVSLIVDAGKTKLKAEVFDWDRQQSAEVVFEIDVGSILSAMRHRELRRMRGHLSSDGFEQIVLYLCRMTPSNGLTDGCVLSNALDLLDSLLCMKLICRDTAGRFSLSPLGIEVAKTLALRRSLAKE